MPPDEPLFIRIASFVGLLLGREEVANALERVVRVGPDLLREHPRLRAERSGGHHKAGHPHARPRGRVHERQVVVGDYDVDRVHPAAVKVCLSVFRQVLPDPDLHPGFQDEAI